MQYSSGLPELCIVCRAGTEVCLQVPQEERHRQRHSISCQRDCLPPHPWDICLRRYAHNIEYWGDEAASVDQPELLQGLQQSKALRE